MAEAVGFASPTDLVLFAKTHPAWWGNEHGGKLFAHDGQVAFGFPPCDVAAHQRAAAEQCHLADIARHWRGVAARTPETTEVDMGTGLVEHRSDGALPSGRRDATVRPAGLSRDRMRACHAGWYRLRSVLRRPVGDRVWFAGEACSADEWATIAGGHNVGGRGTRAFSTAIR